MRGVRRLPITLQQENEKMQRLIKLSVCLIAAVTLCVSSGTSHAGWKWNGNKHGFHQHHWHHWKPSHHVHRPYYYTPRPIIVQQPVYSQPVVVQRAPTTSIVEVAADLTQVPTGGTITLSGRNFGTNTGSVGVAAGELMLAAEVVNWTNDSVTLKVPQLTLAGPARAKFIIFRADRSIADEVPFELLPSSGQ
jgi:hypothetical protein